MAEDAEDRSWPESARLIEVTLDEASLGRDNTDVEHEREVAIFDLLETNNFALEGHDGAGPYTLHLSLASYSPWPMPIARRFSTSCCRCRPFAAS